MTETAVPRLYDVVTDKFITDRAAIIDAVVTRLAQLATWSERYHANDPRGFFPDPRAEAWLREIKSSEKLQFSVEGLVGDLWRGMVTRS